MKDNNFEQINKYDQKQILDLMELKRKLKENSGLFSQMKERDEIEKLKEHIQDYYECNDNFTQKQINEFKNALSTIQKAFKNE